MLTYIIWKSRIVLLCQLEKGTIYNKEAGGDQHRSILTTLHYVYWWVHGLIHCPCLIIAQCALTIKTVDGHYLEKRQTTFSAGLEHEY